MPYGKAAGAVVRAWRIDQAMATWLYDHPTGLSARYKGEMTDRVHDILQKCLGVKIPRSSASSAIARWRTDDRFKIEGSNQAPKLLLWAGGDPALIEWEPPKVERQSTVAEYGAIAWESRRLINELTEEVAHLRRRLDAYETNLPITVRAILDEWIR